ncbi:MAG: hypothetical protein JXB05_24360 [Myxococcaceae bacterium]|nr:hypothetical protein [Myxococcaceae bacterium]
MKPEEKGLEPTVQAEERIREPRVGWLHGRDAEGRLLVDFPGNLRGPLPAELFVPVEAEALARAVSARQAVALLFQEGEPSRPMVVGLRQEASSTTPNLDAVLAGPLPAAPREARVDGKRVLIEGRDEVVLQCGKASITLRWDGEVEIKGINIVTHADERQRIRGGKVQIN